MSAQLPSAPAGSDRPLDRQQMQNLKSWHDAVEASVNHYKPRIQSLINAQFQQYSPPLYASLVGQRRERNLLLTGHQVASFAAALGRDLSDGEVHALGEHTLSTIHSYSATTLMTEGAAAYMTYRGRKTFAIPFYTPKAGFNPERAPNFAFVRDLQGGAMRMTWHAARFVAWSAVLQLMLEPVLRIVNKTRADAAMLKDPRLQEFANDVATRAKTMRFQPPPAPGQQQPGASAGTGEQGDSSMSQYSQPAPTWGAENYQTPQNTFATQQEQPESDWSVLDDDDDASPLAASARRQSNTSAAQGGSWDRLRQESLGGQRQPQSSTPMNQSAWANVQRNSQPQPQQQQSTWGETSGSSDNSYTFSSSDAERGMAKEQAQAEFDALLERERQGAEQQKIWGRK